MAQHNNNSSMMTAPTTTPSPPATTSSNCCCDGTRPLVPDPLTGQTICACQLESAGTSRAMMGGPAATTSSPSATSLGLYHPYHQQHDLVHHQQAAAAAAAQQQQPFMTPDQSSFYAAAAAAAAAANGGHELKDSALAFNGPAAGWPYPSMYYPYDPAMAAYPFGGYGMDLNGSRRKNATRETTATLKAWLSEHKKNPYPTKGEKIMLAIITKMTLTQVSTWFANARRRLKKENKMTWEPKNRNDDDDDDDSSDPEPSTKDHHHKRSHCDGQVSNSAPWNGSHHRDSEDNIDVMLDSDEEELDLLSSGGDSACLSPAGCVMPAVSSSSTATSTNSNNKPKIWSLADMAGSQPSHHTAATALIQQQQQQQQQQAAAAAAVFPLPFGPFGPLRSPSFNNNNTAGGKMFSASFSPSSRLPPPYLDASPYGRAYRYPPPPSTSTTFSPRSAGASAESSSSMALAYNQLMSSMAAHFQQQHHQHLQQHTSSLLVPSTNISKGSTSSSSSTSSITAPPPPSTAGVLENLEKLAALASGSSSNSRINDIKSSGN